MGMGNLAEVEAGVSPLDPDSDGDGLPDPWEIQTGLDPNDNGSGNPANGAEGDPDGDGLSNLFEFWSGADPHLEDSDGDALEDFDEVFVHGTSPGRPDSDFDGLDDHAEIFMYGTGPWDWDSDGDYLSDGEEVLIHGSSPLAMDTDGDWMWDDFEVSNGLDPADAADGLLDSDGDTIANQLEFVFMDLGYDLAVANSAAGFPWHQDPDKDGLSTGTEFLTHLTNPRQPDADGDGLGDGWEIAYGFNPKLDNRSGGPANHHPDADLDGDGLSNADEEKNGTNPSSPNSDGDAASDADEIAQGSNPNDPNDSQLPPNGTVAVNVTFGDPSGSHSEKYRVQLTPLEGDTTSHAVRIRTNRQYGATQTDTFRLPKGAKYRVELLHVGTDPQYRSQPRPDFDYALQIDTSSNGLIVDDPQGIITAFNGASTSFFAAGKNATLYVPLFEWITPANSPSSAPNDVHGDGQNEFTYSDASQGVLTIDLKVLVKPTGTAGVTGHDGVKFSDRCVFMLPPIAGSTFAWDAGNPSGTSAASGEHLVGKATYITLPSSNGDFGLKLAEFQCDGDATTLAQGPFEVSYVRQVLQKGS